MSSQAVHACYRTTWLAGVHAFPSNCCDFISWSYSDTSLHGMTCPLLSVWGGQQCATTAASIRQTDPYVPMSVFVLQEA